MYALARVSGTVDKQLDAVVLAHRALLENGMRKKVGSVFDRFDLPLHLGRQISELLEIFAFYDGYRIFAAVSGI